MQVSIVTVAYNSVAVLAGFLESLPAGVECIVVDNGADDGGRALATAAGATVVVPGRNLGFGAGCNAGAAEATGDVLLFLNPDARLERGALEALLAAMARHPDASAFGPLLRSESGTLSFKRRTRLKPGAHVPKALPSADLMVPVLSGAALLVLRSAFDAVGGFDEGLFLFYEDDDLTLRLAADAGPLVLVPEAVVAHVGGGSSGQSLDIAAFKGYHWGRSRVYASAKHGSRVPLLRGLINGINYLISLKSLHSPQRRAEAMGRIRGAWSMRASKG